MAEPITYRLDQFEGPLDLLLTLINKNKVSITDIPIALILDQYMEYIAEAQRMDLEVASEFIVMASELMLIKSRMILPHEEGTENDPRREIADALILYQQAKKGATELLPMYEHYSGRYVKETDEVPPERGLPLNLKPEMMLKALSGVLKRMKIAEEAKKPSELVNPLIKHHVVSVEDKIEEMAGVIETEGEVSLYRLLKDSQSRAELVARFMGILEMIKVQRIHITSVTYLEDGIADYGSNNMEMTFSINPHYVPGDISESEFDFEGQKEDSATEDNKESE